MIGNDAGELLPCPMCGNSIFGWARPDGDVAIECRTCGVLGPVEDSALAAITGWNTRAHPASAGVLVDRVDNLLIGIGMGWDLDGLVEAVQEALSTTATPASDGDALTALSSVYTNARFDWLGRDCCQAVERALKHLRNEATPDRFGEGYRAGVEASGEWQDIASAPKDRTEFLSYGGTQGRAGSVYPTKWLSPGPYSTENGKNTPGERRFQYPEGFYWAGYDGFVGPVDPTHWRPLPAAPSISALHPATREGK